jgi:hypothetical protein
VTTRNLVLGGALALIGLLAFFLFQGIARNGVTGLAIVTIVLLAVLGFGVIGALTEKQDD